MLNLAATHEALTHFSRAIDSAGHLGMQPPWQVLLARGKVYDRLGGGNLGMRARALPSSRLAPMGIGAASARR
jgi:hypothetical protein